MAMTETPTTSSPPASRRSPATDVALIAAFAALLAACAVVGGIPVGGAGVDITLQTFGVLLAGCVLGPIRGFLSVSLYLGLGAIGLPVFAGHTGGLAPFTGVSAGYLISFPFAAALAGLIVYLGGPLKTRAAFVFVAAAAGTVLIHLCGVVGHEDLLRRQLAHCLRVRRPLLGRRHHQVAVRRAGRGRGAPRLPAPAGSPLSVGHRARPGLRHGPRTGP